MTSDRTRRGYLCGVAAGMVGVSGCVGRFAGGESTIPLGSILPLSADGLLGRLGEHGTAAVEQAVADINRAGGPLDREIEFVEGDSAADPDRAANAYQTLRDRNVVGFVGGALSDVSLRLVEDVPGECMQVSPASTHPSLATKGYERRRTKYFARTVPSDIQQALVMAKVLNDTRFIGAGSAAIVHIDDSFGAGLAEKIAEEFDELITATVPFSPDADSYADVLDAALADEPDGAALVSTPGNTRRLLREWAASGHANEWVLSAGLLPETLPPYLKSVYSASVAVRESAGALQLRRKLRDLTPLAPFTENAYDAMFLLALAIERAGEASPTAIAQNIRAVSTGRGHTVSVGEFDRAKTLLRAGREINYQGASGAVDLNDQLEPLSQYIVEQVQGSQVQQLKLLRTSFFEGN